jgi:hypothetical protein
MVLFECKRFALMISCCVHTHSDAEYGYVRRPVGLLLTFLPNTKSERNPLGPSSDCDTTLSTRFEGTKVERTEDLLSHGVPIALVEPTSLGGLEATSSPTTGHAVRGPMLTFVDKYIALEGAVPFGLSMYRSLV